MQSPRIPFDTARYVAAGGYTLEGIRAMGPALEHLNLFWALAGTLLRLPPIGFVAQKLLDASGLGPREPVRTGQTCGV